MLSIRLFSWGGLASMLLLGCVAANQQSANQQSPQKSSKQELIVTPVAYYTSDKAKDLGTRYADNLAVMVTRIRRNISAQEVRLLNNVESPGGIGFFTHSETYFPDERYLEAAVRLLQPIQLDESLRGKLAELFPKYGVPVLAILLDDSGIFKDPRVTGYGVNLSWQELAPNLSMSRESVVIYSPKETARRFVDNEINQEKFFGESVIFELEGDRWVRQQF